MLLYKYLSSDRIDVLQNGRLRFTQHRALNDPFEGSFLKRKQLTHSDVEKLTANSQSETARMWHLVETTGLEEFVSRFTKALSLAEPAEADRLFQPFEKIAKELSSELPSLERYEFLQSFLVQAYKWILADRMVDLFHYGMEKVRPDILILSLSESNDNGLMWSHYSDSHRGFALGFSKEANFLTRSGVGEIHGPQRISYSPTVTELLNFDLVGSHKAFLVKSAEWAYEKEWRALSMPEFSEHTIPAEPFDIHLFDFDEADVKEVIFGARCDVRTRNKIKNVVRSRGYSRVEFFEAKINVGSYSVRVQSSPL